MRHARSLCLLPPILLLTACQAGTDQHGPASGGVADNRAPAAAPTPVATPPAPPSADKPAAPASVALKEGDMAPLFTATADDGKTYSLAQLRGKYVVLYFYPKDDTSGCTIEAKGFRDDSDKFSRKGAVVLGVSLDDLASHQAFRAKYQLNFPLLLGGAELARLYGVPVHGNYASRQTFLIGRDGRIVKYFTSVDPTGHSAAILTLLQ